MASDLANQLQKGIKNIQDQTVPSNLQTVQSALATIFNVIIASATVIFILMLLFGGITYLSAAGNEEATGKAKRMMIDAVIGLIITLASYAISLFVLNRFGFKVQ